MESEVREQHDEETARMLTSAGFGIGVLAVVVAVLVAPFLAGAWVLALVLGVVAMLCGLSARDRSSRASQWRGLAGTSALLGGTAVIASLFSRL